MSMAHSFIFRILYFHKSVTCHTVCDHWYGRFLVAHLCEGYDHSIPTLEVCKYISELWIHWTGEDVFHGEKFHMDRYIERRLYFLGEHWGMLMACLYCGTLLELFYPLTTIGRRRHCGCVTPCFWNDKKWFPLGVKQYILTIVPPSLSLKGRFWNVMLQWCPGLLE